MYVLMNYYQYSFISIKVSPFTTSYRIASHIYGFSNHLSREFLFHGWRQDITSEEHKYVHITSFITCRCFTPSTYLTSIHTRPPIHPTQQPHRVVLFSITLQSIFSFSPSSSQPDSNVKCLLSWKEIRT
jgi:hypothetical protein